MSIKIDHNKITTASHDELIDTIEELRDEIRRREFKSSKVAIIRVNNFGSVTCHLCPKEAIASLSDVLVDSEEEPLTETWGAPTHEGISRTLSIETVMVNQSEIADKGDWWLE